MKYQFPVINHIDEVLAAVEGRKEFIVAEREGFTVINYVVMMPDTFPPVNTIGLYNGDHSCGGELYATPDDRTAALLRECRGITFCNETGKVVARKLEKFFNAGERPETDPALLDFGQPHVILDKLDGSMITPYLREDGSIEMHTKMGATDVARPVNNFVRDTHYVTFMKEALEEGATPIFEWCSRANRIVIDYPVDRLVLLAVRDNVTGKYLPYEDMTAWAGHYGVEVVRQFAGTANNMRELLDQAADLTGAEGWIVRFDDGHMVKVKGDEYLELHRAVSDLANEKNIWKIVLGETGDDFKSRLAEDQRDAFTTFEGQLNNAVVDLAEDLLGVYTDAKLAHMDRDWSAFDDPDREKKKDFAMNAATRVDPALRGMLFKMYDNKGSGPVDIVREWVLTYTNTGTKVDQVRRYLGDVRWEYNTITE